MSGLSRTPGKRVWGNTPTRVRIPPSPPNTLMFNVIFKKPSTRWQTAAEAEQPTKAGFFCFQVLIRPGTRRRSERPKVCRTAAIMTKPTVSGQKNLAAAFR